MQTSGSQCLYLFIVPCVCVGGILLYVCTVLFQSVLRFLLSYNILSYLILYTPLEACLFSNKNQKYSWKGEELRRAQEE